MASLPLYPTSPGPSQGDASTFAGLPPLPQGDPSGLPLPSASQDLTAGTLPQRAMPPPSPPLPDGFGIEGVDAVLNANGMSSVDLSSPSPGDPGRMGLNQPVPAQEAGRFGTGQRA